MLAWKFKIVEVHCHVGSLETVTILTTDTIEGSLPRRQLRNVGGWTMSNPVGSLPRRQLRNDLIKSGFYCV